MSKSRIPRYLLHKLTGKPGWSSLSISEIDVTKVSNIKALERLFKVTDRDLEATLSITYDEPIENIQINPVLGRHAGFTLTNKVQLTQTITKRYKTLKDAEKEINLINTKRELIEKAHESYFNEFEKTIKSLEDKNK